MENLHYCSKLSFSLDNDDHLATRREFAQYNCMQIHENSGKHSFARL